MRASNIFQTNFHYKAEVGLKLTILLPQFSGYWDYRFPSLYQQLKHLPYSGDCLILWAMKVENKAVSGHEEKDENKNTSLPTLCVCLCIHVCNAGSYICAREWVVVIHVHICQRRTEIYLVCHSLRDIRLFYETVYLSGM